VNVRRARIRLTLVYIGLFAIVIAVFSIVFFAAFAFVLQPDFDIDPELTNEQAVAVAFQLTIARIGAALVVADVIAVAIVGAIAWLLARRALEPIHDAHLRQQRFVADASHETRNPLAAIKTTAEAALTGDRSADDLRDALRTIDTAADRLTRLTGDLLVLARSNDPTVVRRKERVDLSVVVAEAIDQAALGDRYAAIEPRFQPDLTVEVDPDEIGRVARNLAENALRHGGPDVTVSVRTSGTDRDAILEVADDGPGIAPADLDHIFDAFYRAGGDAREGRGAGLGLAIARDLARRNGGRLTVSSRVGAGSTFRLVLPRIR
jgi:signal transduction histidine kinase